MALLVAGHRPAQRQLLQSLGKRLCCGSAASVPADHARLPRFPGGGVVSVDIRSVGAGTFGK